MARPVAASVEELLAGATSRIPMTAPDAKSGATFERVEIDGVRYVVKHVGWELDWIALVQHALDNDCAVHSSRALVRLSYFFQYGRCSLGRVGIEAAASRLRDRSQKIQVGRRVNPLQRLPGCRRRLAHRQPGARHRSLHRGVALRALGVPGSRIVSAEKIVHVTDRPVGL